MTPSELTDLPMDQLMRRWPATIRVLLDHDMRCPACLLAPFMTVAEAARAYGLEPAALAAELARAAGAAPPAPDAPKTPDGPSAAEAAP